MQRSNIWLDKCVITQMAVFHGNLLVGLLRYIWFCLLYVQVCCIGVSILFHLMVRSVVFMWVERSNMAMKGTDCTQLIDAPWAMLAYTFTASHNSSALCFEVRVRIDSRDTTWHQYSTSHLFGKHSIIMHGASYIEGMDRVVLCSFARCGLQRHWAIHGHIEAAL